MQQRPPQRAADSRDVRCPGIQTVITASVSVEATRVLYFKHHCFVYIEDILVQRVVFFTVEHKHCIGVCTIVGEVKSGVCYPLQISVMRIADICNALLISAIRISDITSLQ